MVKEIARLTEEELKDAQKIIKFFELLGISQEEIETLQVMIKEFPKLQEEVKTLKEAAKREIEPAQLTNENILKMVGAGIPTEKIKNG